MRAAVLAAIQSPTVWCRERNIPATTGSELITNGNMETGDPPSSWTAAGATLDGVADERTGGSGVQSINIARLNDNNPSGRQTLTDLFTVGTWYRLTGWGKVIDCTDVVLTAVGGLWRATSTSTSWTLLLGTERAAATTYIVALLTTAALVQSGRHDDASWKALLHSSLFGGAYDLPAKIGLRIRCRPTVPTGTRAGLAICINPALSYYSLIYHNATNAYLDKVENGEANYTSLVNAAATYGAGRSLRLDITGTIAAAKLDLYYGQDGAETQVGVQQTVDLSSYGLQIRGFRTDVTADWGRVTVERIPV